MKTTSMSQPIAIRGARYTLAAVRTAFGAGAIINETDGLSLEFADWRVNVRSSNTEPVVRVNVETRADPALMKKKTDEVLAVLRSA